MIILIQVGPTDKETDGRETPLPTPIPDHSPRETPACPGPPAPPIVIVLTALTWTRPSMCLPGGEGGQGWWALSLDLINPLLPLARPSYNPFRPMLTKQWSLPRSRQMMEGSFALSAASKSGGAGAEGVANGSGSYPPPPQRTSFHLKGVHCPCLSRLQKLPTLTWVRTMIPRSRRMSEGNSLGEEVLPQDPYGSGSGRGAPGRWAQREAGKPGEPRPLHSDLSSAGALVLVD